MKEVCRIERALHNGVRTGLLTEQNGMGRERVATSLSEENLRPLRILVPYPPHFKPNHL